MNLNWKIISAGAATIVIIIAIAIIAWQNSGAPQQARQTSQTPQSEQAGKQQANNPNKQNNNSGGAPTAEIQNATAAAQPTGAPTSASPFNDASISSEEQTLDASLNPTNLFPDSANLKEMDNTLNNF